MTPLKVGLLFFLFTVFSKPVTGQELEKELDIVFVIDEIIWTSRSVLTFTLTKENHQEEIKANYFPGSLTLSESDYKKLFSEEVKSISLQFDYYQYTSQKLEIYNYDLELKKAWLKDYYNVYHIYNLDKRKYRKLFDPLSEDKNYTFTLDSPS